MAESVFPAYESAGWHVTSFAEVYCTHTKGRWGGRPLELEPWQRDFLHEAFRLDENGQRVYKRVLLGIPRKNGKSTLAAAIALYLAVADGEVGPEVILAAGSGDQASIVFDQARAYVDESPDLSDLLDPKRTIIRLRHGTGFVKRVAADGRLQHGLNPNGLVVDELHSFSTPKQEELWSALTTGDFAREEPFALTITTAGFDKQTILGKLFDSALAVDESMIERRPGLTIVRNLDGKFLLWWYGLDERDDDLSDPAVVKLANPASWVTEELLAQAMKDPTVSEADFKRLHCNAWTSAEDSWFRDGEFEALGRPDMDIEDGSSVYVGVDVATKHDSSAVAHATRLEDGRVAIKVRAFANRQDTVAHERVFDSDRVFETLEDYCRTLDQRYDVEAIVYDPIFFGRSSVILSDEGIEVAEMPQQSATMAAAYQSFYQAVKERRLVHDGDPILLSHVAAAVARMGERGWELRKRNQRRKIDALVACVIAHYYAARMEPAHPFEKQGLIAL